MLRFSHNRRNLFVIFQNEEDKVLFLKNRVIEKSVFVLMDAAFRLKERYKNKVEFLLCDNPKSDKEELKTVCDEEYLQ